MTRNRFFALPLLYCLGLISLLWLWGTVPIRAAETQSGLHWQPYSQAAFEQAAREKKLVILDLQAVWCHWCHVMAATTYQDEAVKRLLQEKFVFIQADQDARPDLALRYRDYGWPATVILSADGADIVKRAGYITPRAMVQLLEAVIKDPTPEKADPDDTPVSVLEDPAPSSPSSPSILSKKQREALTNAFFDGFDTDQGAWGHGSHKFLDPDSVEFAMLKAQSGDVIAGKMAQKTLNAQMQLLDPVWGGMYQYSTGGVWTHPHFEKIMSVQAENMRIYAAAYSQFKDPRYLKTAESIASYLNRFLKGPNGAFYVSQDADPKPPEHAGAYFKLGDTARRKRGLPRVDTHQYARENGWAIEALCALYQASGQTTNLNQATYLNQASKAAQWTLENRAVKGEDTIDTLGFYHGQSETKKDSPDNTQTGLYLGDTLAMGRAFTALYLSTGERPWLEKAQQTARFIEQHFRSPSAGYFVAAKTQTTAVKNRDENVSLVRWLNLLSHLTGNPQQAEMARHGMRWLVQPSVANIPFSASVLLPDYEVAHAPLHVTIVGGKTDPLARELFKAALNYPSTYKRLDWWDKAEGPMPNPDVQYPTLAKPAAFVCTQNRCSIPVFDSMKLSGLIDRLSHRK